MWDAFLRELRRDVIDFSFHIWLEPLEAASCEGGTLYVRAPAHVRSWVRDRYTPVLRAAARRAGVDDVELVDDTWTSAPTEALPPLLLKPGDGDGLNPKYTFEQFVIGDGNR